MVLDLPESLEDCFERGVGLSDAFDDSLENDAGLPRFPSLPFSKAGSMHEGPDLDDGREVLTVGFPDAVNESLLIPTSTLGAEEGDDVQAAESALACAAVRASANALLPEEELDDDELDLSTWTISSGASTNGALLLSEVEAEPFLV